MPRLLMTELEFNTACSRIRIRDDYKEALHGHLVLGKTMVEMAEKTGLTRQSINRKTKEFKAINPYPAGWIERSIWLPEDEMKAVIHRSEELLKKAGYDIPDA